MTPTHEEVAALVAELTAWHKCEWNHVIELRKQAAAALTALQARAEAAEAALPRAWERGRDDAAGVFWTAKDEDDYSYWGGDANAHAVRTNLMGKQRSIRALTPPADLTDRVKGGEV